MIRSIAMAVVCLLVAPRLVRGEDLTAEKIRALATQKDDRSKVPEALKVYPFAIEYSVSVQVGPPGEQGKPLPKVIAREALVEGKYLVTTFRPPAYNADLITVVYFDEAQECYRSATLGPDGGIGRSIGTKVGDGRVISWVTGSSPGDKSVTLVQETHSDKERRWRGITIVDGKVTMIMEVVATVTKKPE